MTNVGVIGLGNMGAGMALSAARAGMSVTGYDPQSAFKVELADAKVELVNSIAELCRHADVLVMSLPTSEVVEQVVLGEGGILHHARSGQFVLDTSTADPASTARIARALQGSPLRFVDGPVSGGPRAARTGSMTMLLGGEAGDVARLSPILDALTAKRVHVGPVGSGHAAKLFNNLLCGIHLLAAGEAMKIARAADLDIEQILEGVNAGSGRSAVTEINYPTWILNDAFDSGFTMKLMRKDLRLAGDMIDHSGVDAPLVRQALDLWASSAGQIGDNEDFNRIVQYEPLSDHKKGM